MVKIISTYSVTHKSDVNFLIFVVYWNMVQRTKISSKTVPPMLYLDHYDLVCTENVELGSPAGRSENLRYSWNFWTRKRQTCVRNCIFLWTRRLRSSVVLVCLCRPNDEVPKSQPSSRPAPPGPVSIPRSYYAYRGYRTGNAYRGCSRSRPDTASKRVSVRRTSPRTDVRPAGLSALATDLDAARAARRGITRIMYIKICKCPGAIQR